LGAASGILPVGPGLYDDPINGPSYGLGLTVTTSVFGGGESVISERTRIPRIRAEPGLLTNGL